MLILFMSLGDGALFQYGKIEITLGSKAEESQIRNYLAFFLSEYLVYYMDRYILDHTTK